MDMTSPIPLALKALYFAVVGCAVCACGGAHVSPAEGSDPSALYASQAVDCEHPNALDRSPAIVQLWPPNHKFHLISIEQCLPALARCGAHLDAAFDWGSSDEPIDGIGDGHHAPDIFRVDRTHVCVRSERQGPQNGRTYQLGIVFDTADHHPLQALCTVVVDHDRRGTLAQDDGERYRVTFDDASDQATCDGVPAEPGDDGEPSDPRPPTLPDPPSIPGAPRQPPPAPVAPPHPPSPAAPPREAPPREAPPAPTATETPDAGTPTEGAPSSPE